MREDSAPAKPPSSRTVEDALRPHRKALAALLRTPALSLGDVGAALAQLTEVAVEVLNVERASVWRFDATRSRIECMDLYERKRHLHSHGLVIDRASAPRYFGALEEERTITAADAESDPRTSEFADRYLRPQGIRAMLDAPVFAGPMLIGVVCHEHVGGPRPWKLWEELVASTLADFVALVLATSERIASERALDEYRKHLEELVEERTLALRETEAGLSRLFAASPVPMVLARASDHKIVLANRRADEILSLHQDPSRKLTQLWVHPEDGERLMDAAAVGDHIDDFATQLVGKSGPFYAELAVERITYSGDDCVLLGIHDVSRQREAESTLRTLATRDSLTGVYNRRRFFELGEQERARADRYGHPISIAMLDVDHFKSINDRYGHATGDAVLRQLGERLITDLRVVDVIGRVGGEEFVVLFPETEREAARGVVDRLRKSVATIDFVTPSGTDRFTVSIGLVQRRPKESLQSAIERADHAMYVAKEAGRNRVVVGN